MKINLGKIKISTETLLLLTEIIDKLDIADKLRKLDKPTKEELGTEIIILIATNLYKAQDEIYKFIISYKNLMEDPDIDINVDNYDELYKKAYNCNYQKALKEAKKYDFISLVSEILSIDQMKDFLSQQ